MVTRTFHVLYREYNAQNKDTEENVVEVFDTSTEATLRLRAEYYMECARLSERHLIVDSWCSRFHAKIVLADGEGTIFYACRAEDCRLI